MTALQILNKHREQQMKKYPKDYSLKEETILAAMKEVADMAWEAGVKEQDEYQRVATLGYNPITPDKETFINELFKNHEV